MYFGALCHGYALICYFVNFAIPWTCRLLNVRKQHLFVLLMFVAVFLGYTSTGRMGLCFLWFYVQELPKAQPAVVLVLKRLRRRDFISSDRLGESGNRTFDPWFTRHRFIPYTTA